MGRRDGRDHCPCDCGRFSSTGRSATTSQRQGHADPVPSQSVVSASSKRKRNREKGPCFASRIIIYAASSHHHAAACESIAEATVVDIKVKPGDEVMVDQEIID